METQYFNDDDESSELVYRYIFKNGFPQQVYHIKDYYKKVDYTVEDYLAGR